MVPIIGYHVTPVGLQEEAKGNELGSTLKYNYLAIQLRKQKKNEVNQTNSSEVTAVFTSQALVFWWAKNVLFYWRISKWTIFD